MGNTTRTHVASRVQHHRLHPPALQLQGMVMSQQGHPAPVGILQMGNTTVANPVGDVSTPVRMIELSSTVAAKVRVMVGTGGAAPKTALTAPALEIGERVLP